MSSKPSTQKASASAAMPEKDNTSAKINQIETRQKAINHNNVARVANSHLTSAADDLHVLHSLKTAKPIDRFPGTAKDIVKLSDTLVDAMLLALEEERKGTRDQKVERLRVQFGLKANPA
ncbi:hypothetical protein K490DRAFT_53676 [Saccharata proteae CBS 121410]|uniref:Uncharacterized protein n=1 Tax=Saccharata proteae CBS 121410 TaxID=1314787 RepID=A0A9P4I030_9PEZI|nr:hypothetical protein K490DRAFT_53676 [Saccharata proteae CBS 121410]